MTSFGLWISPISIELVLGTSITLVDTIPIGGSEGEGGDIIYVESRPIESGRNAIISTNGVTGQVLEVLPLTFNARTRVHEYGGGAVAVSSCCHGNTTTIITSDFPGPVYSIKLNLQQNTWLEPQQITPKSDVYRYADFAPHPLQHHLIVAVLEDHTNPKPSQVINSLVLIDSTTQTLLPVASGSDFYSAPCFNHDGTLLAFKVWELPEMPWTKSSIYVLSVTTNEQGILSFGEPRKIAGAEAEAVSQSRWAKDENRLIFLSDRSGYSELYSWEPESNQIQSVLNELTGADIGGPDWTFGNSTHDSLGPGKWICRAEQGQLRIIDLVTSTSELIETPYTSISTLRVISPTEIVVIASSATLPTVLSRITLPTSSSTKISIQVIKSSSPDVVDPAYISAAQAITFPTTKLSDDDQGAVAHGFYYAPVNKDYRGVEGELPPLIVHCHGGPTSAAGSGLNYSIQYFTSRGFAYVDVNYGGSTGYGRAFRERLNKNWGVVDVNDTIACVEYLVQQGKVDPKRVAIVGGSAGGYTVLACLCASKVFTAGTSLYGVSDLALLAGETHKFESEYLFALLGGTPEQIPEVYHDRSPLTNAASITAPLLLLQGTIDMVVPVEQATKMASLIVDKSKVEVVLYEGEGHGFRKYENKKDALERELAHYLKTWSIIAPSPVVE